MAASLAGAAVGTALVPLSVNVWIEGLFIVFQGLAMGFLDSGANLMLIYLHGSEVNPYMQAMHFFFSFGAFLAPLLVKLSQDSWSTYKYAWWFISCFMVPVVVGLVMYESPKDPSRRERKASSPAQSRDLQSTAASSESNSTSISSMFSADWSKTEWLIVLATAGFLFFYVGAEVATSNLLVSFVESRPLADRDTAYEINATFWGALALFRLIAVPLSLKIRPAMMLFGNIAGSVVGLALMWLGASSSSSLPTFWLGIFVWGAALASSFPTALNLAESMMPLTGAAGSIFMIGASAGEFILPAIMGVAQDAAVPKGSSNALLIGCFIATMIQLGIVICLKFLCRQPLVLSPSAPALAPPANDEAQIPLEASISEFPVHVVAHVKPKLNQPAPTTTSPAPRLPAQVSRLPTVSHPASDTEINTLNPAPRNLNETVARAPKRPVAAPPRKAPSFRQPAFEDELDFDGLGSEDVAEDSILPELDELYDDNSRKKKAPDADSHMLLPPTVSRIRQSAPASSKPAAAAPQSGALIPPMAAALRRPSAARHIDDLGRIWINKDISHPPKPIYLFGERIHDKWAAPNLNLSPAPVTVSAALTDVPDIDDSEIL